jgi:osmoprotectant transport system permease protein
VDAGPERVVNAFGDAITYLNDPFNWTKPKGILELAAQHLVISGLAVGIALLVALPLAVWLGHTGHGGAFTVGISNVSRAIPTLAILTIFAVTPLGFSIWAPVIALAVFAVPPVLANTYVGFREVDRDVVEAARGMGMSTGQLVRQVEFPLALPLIMTGIRTAAVQVVATATLAALLAGGTLGAIIRSRGPPRRGHAGRHHPVGFRPPGLRRRRRRGAARGRAGTAHRSGPRGDLLARHAGAEAGGSAVEQAPGRGTGRRVRAGAGRHPALSRPGATSGRVRCNEPATDVARHCRPRRGGVEFSCGVLPARHAWRSNRGRPGHRRRAHARALPIPHPVRRRRRALHGRVW